MYKFKVLVNKAVYTTQGISQKQAVNNVLFKLFGTNKQLRDSADVEILWVSNENILNTVNESVKQEIVTIPSKFIQEFKKLGEIADHKKTIKSEKIRLKELQKKKIHPLQGNLFEVL